MEDVIVELKWWSLEQLRHSRCKIHESKLLKSSLPLSENRQRVDNILSVFGDEIELPIFIGTA